MNAQPMLRFDVEYPDRPLSRLTTLFRVIMVIPHMIVLSLFGGVVSMVTLLAWFAILVTGRYPRGLWDLTMMYMRWSANVGAYYLLMRDEYPPFGEGAYPVTFELDYPDRLSRWKIFLKWLLIIPNAIVLGVLAIAMLFVMGVAWLAILFTGRYPRGMFDFVLGVSRWGHRVNAYLYLLTDAYPPFSMAPVGASMPGYATGGL